MIPLPYDDVDVEALLHNGGSTLADAAAQRGTDVLQARARRTPPRASPPTSPCRRAGSSTPPGAQYYRTVAKAKALVLLPDAVPSTGDNPSASAKSPSTPAQLLLSDDVLDRLVTAGVPAGATPRMAEQEVIAELAEAHIEDGVATASSKTGRSAAAADRAAGRAGVPDRAWLTQLLTDTSHLSWLSQTPVSDAAGLPHRAPGRTAVPDERPGRRDPGAARAVAASDHRQHARACSAIRRRSASRSPNRPDSIVQPIRDAALAAVSSRWRADPSQAFPFRNSAEIALTSLAQQVRVVASPQVTLTSRSGQGAGDAGERSGCGRRRLAGADLAGPLAGELRHRRHAAPCGPGRRFRSRSR